jgi:hypothetical protein
MTDALARWHAWRQSSTDATSRSGGTPKFYVGARRVDIPDYTEPDKTYLRRWYLIETPWFGLKLHHILRSDQPNRGFHDHPWSFVSFKLRGSYTELRLVKNADGSDRTYRTHRRRLTLVRTTDMHLVDIDRPAGVCGASASPSAHGCRGTKCQDPSRPG